MARHSNEHSNHGWQIFLASFLLVVLRAGAHVQPLERPRSQSHSYDKSPEPALYPNPLGDHESPSLTEQILLQNHAAAISKNLDAQHPRKDFHIPHQNPNLRREAVELASLNEEVAALTYFRDQVISGGDTAGLRDWNANDFTPCGWTGVSCLPSKQRVVGLSLPNLQLEGSISSALVALSKLQFLRELNLSRNNFTDGILEPALLNFSSLTFLDLSFNQISGQIPDHIGELANLQWLALEGNSLLSEIPASIGNCTLLRVLNLQSNFLHGQIPHMVGRLSHLEVLSLGTNIFISSQEGQGVLPAPLTDLSGSIPASLGNCSSLVTLDLTFNPKLGGQIPPEIVQLESLQLLSLTACSFNGIIPRWIGNLSSLVTIGLGENHFQGTIPAEIGRLRSLLRLNLPRNNLTGNIPSDLGNCTSLIVFIIGYNALTGAIPHSLANCTALQYFEIPGAGLMDPEPVPSWIASLTQITYLSVSSTSLFGAIPNEFGRLANLEVLVMDFNYLTGSIPSSLSNCTSLDILSFEQNNLRGHIPSEIGFLTNLVFLNLAFNHLSGSIPASLINLTQLQVLECSANELSGTIDGQWGLLSQLADFIFESNFLVGPIPRTLSNCSYLQGIAIDQNMLAGDIPASFGNLSQLYLLYASQMHLNGKLPADLAKCLLLQELDLSNNELEGLIPPEFGQLSFLLSLNLSLNSLNGSIPMSLANLTELDYLDLSYNQLSGSVPGLGISRLRSLIVINISDNFLSGSLLPEWSSLTDVRAIAISNNSISGSIVNLANLTNLENLDVSLNNFSGQIPKTLPSLPYLAFFNASFNNFQGPVPASEAFVSKKFNLTADSFLGNPRLCGAILGPSQECPVNTPHSRDHASCDFLQCSKKWLAVPIIGVFIFFAVAVVVWITIRCKAKAAAQEEEKFDILLNFSPKVLKFAPADILAVIKEGKKNVIGIGARSVVYKGSLPGSNIGMVAIKTFVCPDTDGMDLSALGMDRWQHMLEKEASIQAKLRHQNILKVLSFCSNLDFKALVLEYMPKGSLQDLLYPPERSSQVMQKSGGLGSHLGEIEQVSDQHQHLLWSSRLSIAIDIAEGLTYLHHECPKPLIHGDLKPSNILLDEGMTAKIADFGISKFVDPQQEGDSATGVALASSIHGTAGYMPPEYAFVLAVSTKGDVFSYGVIVMEMLTGRPPTKFDLDVPSEAGFRDWNLQRYQRSPMEFLDPILRKEACSNTGVSKQLMLSAKLAFLATLEHPESRPSMKDICTMLMQIKDLGAEVIVRKSVNELVNQVDENIWEIEDPNA